MAVQNLAVKLCGVLQSQDESEVTAREWRLIGQEQDGSQLFTWISDGDGAKEVMHIGVYTNKTKTLVTLYTFDEKKNIIQASVNITHSLLVYVVKVLPDEETKEAVYCPYLISILPDKVTGPEEVEEGSTKQIMVQYVYGKSNKYSPGIRNDRFIIFKHLEYIKIYRTPMFLNECEDGTEKWGFDGIYPEPETIVKVFSWAQWDCVNQVLFYIHYRAPTQSFAEGEEAKSPCEVSPTLSALQFHADLPHETVLNIPLSLPHVVPSAASAGGAAGEGAEGGEANAGEGGEGGEGGEASAGGGAAVGAACGSYEDDPVPLRVHDCSLDLYIVCDQRGLLCVCHHYLYKPLDESTSSLVLEDAELRESGVNFAYSVTLAHHGCVVHSVVPDLPWPLARALRPSYTLYADNHLLVNIPMLFTHLIDISPHHEPCCHILIPRDKEVEAEGAEGGPALAPLLGWGPHAMVDLNTLDVHTMKVDEKDLAATFKGDTVVENKLGIIHYLIHHEGNLELAEELISWMCVRQADGVWALRRVMQEYLVAGAHAGTRRALPAAAAPLAAMLPFTLHLAIADLTAGGARVCVRRAGVWRSAAAVVLAPRQRVAQFAEDAWTRLWRALAQPPPPPRHHPRAVLDRLRVSLPAYQPEALSRCSTPMSPGAPPLPRRASLAHHDALPFPEVDVCTASKQEHVIAANLRAVSVHLMREARAGQGAGQGGGGDAGALESGVHALATRWAGAQLEAARALCRAAVRAVAAAPLPHQPRGFAYVDELEPAHALVVFKLLEQYQAATEAVAFPLPQGFGSFLTYLAYRALRFPAFVQRVHRGALDLHIDVLKAIMASPEDASGRSAARKLRLAQLAGEGRARRALAAWAHRAALPLRARHHAAALLSGDRDRAPSRHHHDALDAAVLPSGERLSPLDTFLDLLTAKASLNELDFNLIIQATLASVQDANKMSIMDKSGKGNMDLYDVITPKESLAALGVPDRRLECLYMYCHRT